MALDFKVKDIKHKTSVKFVHAFLPDAKKPYNLRPVNQPVLDVHGLASKADVYNIATSPKVIEEGMNAGFELMFYLLADGFKIKTPIGNMAARISGEYDGSETSLPDGVFPKARMQISAHLREYLKEYSKVIFDGMAGTDGMIAQVKDEATELVDEIATIGKLLTIRGYGLKVEWDASNKDATGVYFVCECGEQVKADILAVNEPRTLKVIVPADLEPGGQYRLLVITQSSVKNNGHLLKELRQVRADFTLTAQS